MTLPRNLDLNLLRVFDVLMEERNVTQAARRLNMSQPSCSNALDRLRNALDDRILERQGHKMVPSRFAEAFWPRVRQSLDDLGAGLTELQSFAPENLTGHLRLGMDPYSAAAFGAAVSSRILNDAPNTRLSLVPLDLNSIESSRTPLDIGIGTVWTEQAGIEREVILSEEFVVLSARDPGDNLGAPMDLDTYLGARHLLLSDKGIVPGNVDAALKPAGRVRNACFAAPGYETLAAVLTETKSITTVGRSLAEQLARRNDLSIETPPLLLKPFTISLAWYKRDGRSPQLEWLRQLCKDVLQPEA